MEGHGAYSNTTSVQKALGESLLELTTIGSQEFYRCVVCDCSMAGDVPARSHLMGGPHMKALRNYFHKTVIGPSMVRNEVTSGSISSDSMTSVPLRVDHETLSRPKPTSYASSSVSVDQAIRCGDVTLETIGPVEYMNCNICNTSCTGTVSMEEHLSGAPHLKRIRKRNSSKMDANEFSPSTTVRSSGTGMPPQPQSTVSQYFNTGSDPVQDAIRDGIVVINPTVNAEQYTCQVCNIECTGEVPMNAHLNGKAHQKCLKRHRPSRTTSNASTLPDIVAGNQCPISSSTLPTARRIISPRTSPSPSPSRQSRSSQHLPYSVPAYEIPQAVPSPSVKGSEDCQPDKEDTIGTSQPSKKRRKMSVRSEKEVEATKKESIFESIFAPEDTKKESIFESIFAPEDTKKESIFESISDACDNKAEDYEEEYDRFGCDSDVNEDDDIEDFIEYDDSGSDNEDAIDYFEEYDISGRDINVIEKEIRHFEAYDDSERVSEKDIEDDDLDVYSGDCDLDDDSDEW